MTTPPPASPPPFVDGDLIALKTDQHGKVVLVWLRGYAPMSPDDLLARLRVTEQAQAALGAARADAAGLEARVQRLLAEIDHRQRIDQEDMQRLQANYARLYAEAEQLGEMLIAVKTAPRRMAVALALVRNTERRLALHIVTADTALQAFVEAKRIATVDRDEWYVEQFSIEDLSL
jgi:multidrug resistance efflux pump